MTDLIIFVLIYVVLAILQYYVMQYLPQMWTIRNYSFNSNPLYSAWGIGWVTFGAYLFGFIDTQTLLLFFVVYMLCLPFIFLGMQPPDKKKRTISEELNSISDTLHKLENIYHKSIWKF